MIYATLSPPRIIVFANYIHHLYLEKLILLLGYSPSVSYYLELDRGNNLHLLEG